MALTPPVQSRSIATGLASTLTLPFSSNNAAGNCLIVCHASAGAALGDRVTDSANTYGADVEDIGSAGSPDAIGGISSAPNCAAGANTVAISGAGSTSGRNLSIAEYAGLATVASFDKSATNTGFGGTTANSISAGPTAALSQASELVIGFAFAGNALQSPYTEGSGLTQRTDVAGGTNDSTYGDKEVAATTAVSGSFTATANANWGCIVATYKAAAAAAATVAPHSVTRPFPFKPGQPPSRNAPYR